MLSAILHGKAGRIQLQGAEHRVRWRDVFKCSEDLLSAVFFSRVRYLSPESATNVMTLLLGEEAAAQLGELQSIQLWSRLGGTNGRSWVEPDVQMLFANALVVVEVKPPFGGYQYIEQWRAQVQALAQEFAESGEVPQHFHFVALGNNTCEADAQTQLSWGVDAAFIPQLHQVEWEHLAQMLPELRTHAISTDRAVIDDWLEAFSLFGIAVQPPFQWPDLLTWADRYELSIEQDAWPKWQSEQTGNQPAPCIVEPNQRTSCRIDWMALNTFAFNHPLNFS